MPRSLFQKLGHSMMRTMARIMPSCREVTQMVSEAMDRNLPLSKRLMIRLHIGMCHLCRRYEEQLHLLREGTRRYADPEQNTVRKSLSPGARDRLKRALENKM